MAALKPNDAKRPKEESGGEPQAKFSHLLLEIPADADTRLPVWDAMRAQQADLTWAIHPYGIHICFSPLLCDPARPATQSSSSEASQNQMVQPVFPQSSLVQTTTNPPPCSSPSLFTFLSVFGHPPPDQTSPPASAPPPITAAATATTATNPTTAMSAALPKRFHTRSLSELSICDRFLLGACQAGAGCRRHHTEYPFHWQLRSAAELLWLDLRSVAQARLERFYCDVTQGSISMKDVNDVYMLNFASMELDSCAKYDAVRRLSSTWDPALNPHLHTRWCLYWTGIVRLPSPMDASESNFGVDLLADFSCWYPPVWSLAVLPHHFSLVEMPRQSRAYARVRDLFHQNLSDTSLEIAGLQQVQNLLHWDKYQRGCSPAAAEATCWHNFDQRLAGANGNSLWQAECATIRLQ
ncbi:unnamed protein product [Merluccius merluccius]